MKLIQDGSTSGDGTIVETCGIKIATEQAGKEDEMRARRMKSTLADKYHCVTFALDRMKLSTVHRKKKNRKRRSILLDLDGESTSNMQLYVG